MRPGDVVLGRLDVLPSVDGVEPGLEALRALEVRGVIVLNGPEALMRAHDKLLTAQVLAAAGLPHPETRLAVAGRAAAGHRRAGRRQAALRQLGAEGHPLQRPAHACGDAAGLPPPPVVPAHGAPSSRS